MVTQFKHARSCMAVGLAALMLLGSGLAQAKDWKHGDREHRGHWSNQHDHCDGGHAWRSSHRHLSRADRDRWLANRWRGYGYGRPPFAQWNKSHPNRDWDRNWTRDWNRDWNRR